MPDTTPLDDTLTPAEVARQFRVSPTTVAKWAEEGKIPSFRTPGGHRRFRREDVAEFLAVAKAVGE
jgi:excisionase family DNA binding protein